MLLPLPTIKICIEFLKPNCIPEVLPKLPHAEEEIFKNHL